LTERLRRSIIQARPAAARLRFATSPSFDTATAATSWPGSRSSARAFTRGAAVRRVTFHLSDPNTGAMAITAALPALSLPAPRAPQPLFAATI